MVNRDDGDDDSRVGSFSVASLIRATSSTSHIVIVGLLKYVLANIIITAYFTAWVLGVLLGGWKEMLKSVSQTVKMKYQNPVK